MYDIAIFSATFAAADRLRSVMSLEGFLSMFKEEQHEQILDVLTDLGYIEMYWPTEPNQVITNRWTGKPSWRWT